MSLETAPDGGLAGTGDPPTSGATAGPGQLYDGVRAIHYPKPACRGWLHLTWFLASLVFGSLLIGQAQGTSETAAVAVYVASLSALFGTSAVYHRGTWAPRWGRRLQRLDQAMIIFLIAGTATPPLLLDGHGGYRLGPPVALWAVALAVLVTRQLWMGAPEALAGGLFIGLGVLAGTGIPVVWVHAGAGAGCLLLGGGVLYIVGAVGYHRRWPDAWPAVFGYHEVFHCYVCAAATCQFVAISLFLP